MNTVDKGPLGALSGAFATDKLGHLAVGQQHELFNQLVRILNLLEIDAQRFAVFVQHEFRLVAFETDGAVAEPFGPQLLGQSVEGQHRIFQGVVRIFSFDNVLRLFVRKTAVGENHGPSEPFVEDFRFIVQFEDGREGEFLFVGTERAEVVREFLGQHRHGAVHQIDACGAIDRFGVNRVARTHIVGHVGNMHPHLPIPVGELANGEGVVEVLGIGRVDGEGGHPAHILAAFDFRFRNAGLNFVSGFFELFGEVVGEVELGQDGVHFGVVVPRVPQHVYHLARGIFGRFGPFGDANNHLLPVLGAVQRPQRHKNIRRHGP